MQIELVQVGTNDPKLAQAFEEKVKEILVPDLTKMGLRAIAMLVRRDWKKVNYAAEPYLSAMSALETINDKYYEDSAKSIVTYFLGNAQSWRGEVAKAVKAELNRRIK